jgi:hypothetical protein
MSGQRYFEPASVSRLSGRSRPPPQQIKITAFCYGRSKQERLRTYLGRTRRHEKQRKKNNNVASVVTLQREARDILVHFGRGRVRLKALQTVFLAMKTATSKPRPLHRKIQSKFKEKINKIWHSRTRGAGVAAVIKIISMLQPSRTLCCHRNFEYM